MAATPSLYVHPYRAAPGAPVEYWVRRGTTWLAYRATRAEAVELAQILALSRGWPLHVAEIIRPRFGGGADAS